MWQHFRCGVVICAQRLRRIVLNITSHEILLLCENVLIKSVISLIELQRHETKRDLCVNGHYMKMANFQTKMTWTSTMNKDIKIELKRLYTVDLFMRYKDEVENKNGCNIRRFSVTFNTQSSICWPTNLAKLRHQRVLTEVTTGVVYAW